MIRLSRFEKVQKEFNAISFKPLIDGLVNCNEKDFLIELEQIREWDRPRDDLFIWIPVLNKIDTILSDIVKRYAYNSNGVKGQHVRLVEMSADDENTCVILTAFTSRLLYSTENRYIYSSIDVMNDLLNCPNFKVKYGAMKVLAYVGERFIVARERLESIYKTGLPELKKKSLALALALPSSAIDDNGDQFSIVDLYFDSKKFPKKWLKFKYSYYNNEDLKDKRKGPKPANSQLSTSSMKKLSLSNEELKKYTLQQIFNKGMSILPAESWYDFSLKVTVAKAFSDDAVENLELRDLIVQTKFNAVAFINTVYIPPQVSSKLFEVDPYTFNSLTDFISLAEPKIPSKLRLDALFALECISLKHVWCSDIMRNLGGNLSHGTMFQILRQIGKLLRDETEDPEKFSEEYNVRFFYLISNLAEVKTLHDSLLAAGLIPSLLEIISSKNRKSKRTLASATHLLEVFINDAESTTEFINHNGFTTLINSIASEVDLSLENPDCGRTVKYATIDYTIAYRQQAFIRSLLKLVLKLLRTDSGDRIRNLIDSPILVSLKQLLGNMNIFGSTLTTFTLDVVQRVINSEPTIYSVLVDAGLIPFIIDNFAKFIVPHAELLFLLPDVISALCLNNDGLQKVKEKNMVGMLLTSILDPTYARALSWKEEVTDFGTSIDELARHYPDLKPLILESFCNMVKEIPSHLHFDQKYLYQPSAGQDYFYHSKDDPVLYYEEGSSQLSFWDEQQSSSIVDCFSSLFYGMALDNSTLSELPEMLKTEDLLATIVMDNPPFDYVSSQAMLNITDVLQIFDEQRKSYGFTLYLDILNKRLRNIKDFLVSDCSVSYFLSIKGGEDNSHVEYILSQLSSIIALLHIITNVYVTLMNLSRTRVKEIIEYFSHGNFELLDNLALLFQKAGFEDMYIRNNLPAEVMSQTTAESFGHTPPIHIHATKPVKGEIKDFFTSAKFKNTYQIRHMLNKVQTGVAIIFRCFLRLCRATNILARWESRPIEIRIFTTIVKQLIKMLEVAISSDTVSYTVVLLHFNTYVMTFPKTTITTTEIVQTIPAYLFYQDGGYRLYVSLIMKLFTKLTNIENISEIENIDYLKNTEDVLTVSSIINILSFFNKSIQLETLENGKSIDIYYPNVDDYQITPSLMKRLKTVSLLMISKLRDEYQLFQPQERTIPYAVFKQILTLWKNSYTLEHSSDTDELFYISWDQVVPSVSKVSVLSQVGISEEKAARILEDTGDTLVDANSPFIPAENFQQYSDLLKSFNNTTEHKFVYDEFTGSYTLDELRYDIYSRDLNKQIFNVLPFYPKLVNAFAKTLIQIFLCLEQPIENFASAVLEKIRSTDISNEAILSSLIHLFGIFLNEKFVYQHSNSLLIDFMKYLENSLEAKYVNTSWFSKILYSYEIILSKSELPIMEEPSEHLKLRHQLVTMLPVYHIERSTKQKIFDILIRIDDISNFYSALAISRILLLYSRDDFYAKNIVSSHIISKLLKVIGTFQKYEKINFLESSFLLLVRRCFENNEFVSNMIKHELKKSFTTRTLGSNKEKERDLTGLLEEKPHVVMRNPDSFADILCRTARFEEFGSDGVLLNFTMKRHLDLASIELGHEISVGTDNIPSRTGIVHLLLSQLMAAAQKDWVSEPSSADNKEKVSDTRFEKPQPSRNPVCAYMIFILKILAELISSYKQCKLEFLTFDRRNLYTERPKPRTTALNFFLYQLLDKNQQTEQGKDEAKRREVIGMLAKSVIVGFVTSVYDDNNEKMDPKDADIDMTFIRKFSIEALQKALKLTISSSKSLELNVSKLDSWFTLIGSLVYIQAPYLRLLIDPNKIDADRYQVCRLMIELEVPTSITDCMAKLDLNYPFCKRLFNDAVEVLNAINSTRNDFADFFKIEGHDDDVDEEEESEKEDVPDMFRNSALGMYDVEDIEEDDPDNDDESLIGDDEEIAFVDSEEDGYEVVFSDDNNEEENNENTDYSEAENSNIEEVVFEIDPDNMEIEAVEDIDTTDEASSSDFDNDSYSSHHEDIDNPSDYESGMDIDISDFDFEESDWESGLSDLATSEDDDDDNGNEDDETFDENTSAVRLGNGRTIWSLGNGVELEDEPSDEEQRGVFQGIEHAFNPDDQALFRVQELNNHHNNHNRSGRHHQNTPLIPPSLTLLNGSRRNQSNLVNPLAPSGLEQIENDITDQQTTMGTGIRPRNGRPHFADMLFSGELLDERILDGIVLKSSVARWKDIFDMFYDSKNYASYLVPTILNRLYQISLDLHREAEKRQEEELEKIIEGRIEKEKKTLALSTNESLINSTEQENQDRVDESPAAAVEENEESHEPVFVNMEGTEVDIGGTDIDPEFLNALPEDIRIEVFTQHVRERRADAHRNHVHSREIDSDFLDAIPEDIREEILEQEAVEERLNAGTSQPSGQSESGEDEIEDINMLEDDRSIPGDHNNGVLHDTRSLTDGIENKEQKKPTKSYFEPLIDRPGTVALMKSVFISQPYIQREIYHELFYRLCSSKQNRSDIINLLLMILADGAIDQHSLERVYNMILSRSHSSMKTQNMATRQLPPDCTPLIVANQAIEILQYLLDSDSKLKFFFIREHENLMVNKTKKDMFNKNEKLPIKYLFSLLERKIITDETVLMDLLTSILQICTKPIAAMLKNSNKNIETKRKFQVPSFEKDELRKIVSIICLDSCSNKVFQQTLNVMYNLSFLSGSIDVFTLELIKLAKQTSSSLITDMNNLTEEVKKSNIGSELDVELVQKLTLPSSEQAKLLKILTAMDYLYTHKKKLNEYNEDELSDLYNKMKLGGLWSSLSKCMIEFEEKKNLGTSATVLLPSIESLMVVCKHCKISTNGTKITKYEEGRSLDFSSISVDNLFFPFTDLHKKLLNQMVRSNPKLMSGPFSLLVKNPKILDFDNKRYYFMAKLRSDVYDRPKLSMTVRRDQVFLDSYRWLFFKTNEEIKQSKLEITFKGESGVDAGGLTREWYQVLSRQMFNPDYALFLPVASDKTTFHPNRTSGINPEHLSFFKFIGMIIGKAIRDQCFLDCHFSREVYKNILGKPVALKDMESIDPDYYKSLVWILENDITDIIEETFSVETDDYGEHKIVDLIENGRNISVTEENKQAYVKSIVEYKLNVSVKEQMDNFLVGFYALIPKDLISIFDEQEIELLISGLPDIDIDDWKNNTTYVNFTASCKQVNYFWRAVRSFDTEERAKLLQFVTGTSKVPLNGFKELSGVNGICKFSIHKDYGSVDRLPSSHTCFNQLNLPLYNSYETLRGSLLIAINEGYEGFGLA